MKKLPKTISEAEFLDIIKQVKDNKTKIAFMLGFYEGLRVSEVIKLKPENIDKQRGFIHIIAGKGNKDRDIPIMPPVESGLKHLPMDVGVRGLQKRFKRHFKSHPELSFHSLRHSGATYYLNDKKVDIRQIQQLLGHSRLDTTQIYTHISPSQLKEAFGGIWG
ncbi:MAG: tyrosine-type recombinase/integrase [Nanoarchaeota archaeon]